MQTYIRENITTFENLTTVKPSVKKVFIKNIVTIFTVMLLILIFLIYLQANIGLDTFMMPFEALDITLSATNLVLATVAGLLGIAFLFILGNYLALKNVRYEFYRDRMVFYEPQLLVFITHKDIPFKNVTRISCNYAGFMNKLLNSGEITIDLTGMNIPNMKLKFVDETERVIQQLQGFLREYNSIQQMQFQENYKISNIMNKF